MTTDLIAGHQALDARAILPLLLDEEKLDALAGMGPRSLQRSDEDSVIGWALRVSLRLPEVGGSPERLLSALPASVLSPEVLQAPVDRSTARASVPPPSEAEQLWLDGMADPTPFGDDLWPPLALERPRPRDLAFIDLETTGLDPTRHEILEIGVVRVDPRTLAERETVEVKVRPTRIEDADPKALRINHYSGYAWRKAVDLAQALAWVAPVLEGTTLCGHNVAFDRAFLDAAWRRAGVAAPELDHHTLDTASLAWPLLHAGLVDSLSLSVVCEVLGIELGPAHRALTDARRSLEVARRMLIGVRERAAQAMESGSDCCGRCGHGCA